jgi:hypothetical protein
MELVHFFDQSNFNEQAEKTFLLHKAKINSLLPEADVQHVGIRQSLIALQKAI